jgi:hypothetical protein
MESSRLSVSCVKDEGYELVWGNRAEMRRQRAREERSGAGGGLRRHGGRELAAATRRSHSRKENGREGWEAVWGFPGRDSVVG